jgi:hypothetical protein
MATLKKVIVLQKGKKIEVWGSLTEACQNHPDFKYWALTRLKLEKGVKHNGWEIKKVNYNKKFKSYVKNTLVTKSK